MARQESRFCRTLIKDEGIMQRLHIRQMHSGRILNKSVWGSMGKVKFCVQSSCISCLTSLVCTDPYSWLGQNNWGWTLMLTHDIKTCVWSDGVKDCAACLPASSVLQGLCIKEVRGCTDTEFCDVVAMLLGMKASRGCQTETRNKAWAFLRVFVSPPLYLQDIGRKTL